VSGPGRGWRAFPFDATAVPGTPFSPTYVHPGQTAGRFDLQDQPPVLYLAESPEHAVGEVLQAFRGRRIGPDHLRRHGWPLAVVSFAIADGLARRIPDLTDPRTLLRLDLRPDALASHDRRVTQGIARTLHAAGEPGLRWWSALTGAWHAFALFTDRLDPGDLHAGEPELLTLDHPAVATAAAVLGIARAPATGG
jgi:RES domain